MWHFKKLKNIGFFLGIDGGQKKLWVLIRQTSIVWVVGWAPVSCHVAQWTRNLHLWTKIIVVPTVFALVAAAKQGGRKEKKYPWNEQWHGYFPRPSHSCHHCFSLFHVLWLFCPLLHTYTVLHMFMKVLFLAENHDNHKNWAPSMLPHNLFLISFF